MDPAIRAIPTFGTYLGGTTAGPGINRQPENIPSSQVARMIPTGGIAPIIGYIDGEEG
jgi:hypothetical protein